ncbi:peroxisomal membrane protein 11B-like [Lytechinus variegatus]|uniref:peroxisomal membrane protein 11B-like n=1 Tax=Lytechinus variegatus TaxID=7654 RepID=UPI001BB296DB|nr:peroxisomal membrane protein 11B-like [Lytechinus variegatus]XP_041463827.1 peroxisomal membrane protein 11B-like [Lytechinus variegatus]
MEASLAANIISFLGKTGGRDKLYRTCQYGSRFVWWCVQESKRDPELVKKLKGLDSHLSTSRKLLRIGKSVEFLRAAQKSIHRSDPFLQFTITLANINKASYLLIDHLLWMHRIGLVKVNSTYYGHLSSRFWLATLLLSLSTDLYAILGVLGTLLQTDTTKVSLDSEKAVKQYSNGSASGAIPSHETNGHRNHTMHRTSLKQVLMTLFRYHLGLILDTLKNLADLFLPLSYLGHINISSGLQGLLGLISSIIGVLTVWDTKYRLAI